MNWLDIAVGILLLVAFILGFRKGLIKQLVGLATIILAAVFGGQLAKIIMPAINSLVNLSPQAARVLSFIFAFAAIAIVLALIGKIVQRFLEVVFLSFVNRLAGAAIAVGTMMVFLSIILNLVLLLDMNEKAISKQTKDESFFFGGVEAVVPAIVPYLNPKLWDEYVPEKYREGIEKKADSLFRQPLQNTPIDSTFQQRYFDT